MAVYERTYKRYAGPLTAERWRFLTLPRYALREVFQSKLFLAFFVLACLPFVVEAIIIYMHHNLPALLAIKVPLDQLIPIDATFFNKVVEIQGLFAFFLALAVGPGLVSTDLRNNALPLYFSRPFTRVEYVLGKLSVLLILMSVVTWIPALLLFLFQASLAGLTWTGDNLWLGWAALVVSWEWMLVLSLVTLALSAWVKWKPVARIALLAAFFVLRGWGLAINATLNTRWGGLVSMMELNDTVRLGLFRQPIEGGLTVAAAWIGLAVLCLLSLWLLNRRVRAYEVIR